MTSTRLGDIIHEKIAGAADVGDDEYCTDTASGVLCVAGKFAAVLDMVVDTLANAQAQSVFCVSPNNVQLPNQLQGRSGKRSVCALGLAMVAKPQSARSLPPRSGG
jgi:chitin synthase